MKPLKITSDIKIWLYPLLSLFPQQIYLTHFLHLNRANNPDFNTVLTFKASDT